MTVNLTRRPPTADCRPTKEEKINTPFKELGELNWIHHIEDWNLNAFQNN
jgi:hypothetical protein